MTASKPKGLTPDAIFRVWKAAIKDDEKLLDELIASVHEQMMSVDQAAAERVMSLIIRRHCNAKAAFKAMLIALRTQSRSPTETPSTVVSRRPKP